MTGHSPGLSSACSPGRACLELLHALGLRASEARAARVVDLDLNAGTLLVRRAKRGKSRALPLPPAALPHLSAYLRDGRQVLAAGRGRDRDALLLNQAGHPLGTDGVRRIVVQVAERRDLRAQPHHFRHAVATHLHQAGVSVEAIRELLGHRNVATTSIYLGVEQDEPAVEGLTN